MPVDFIVPCYNEADNIVSFYDQFVNAFEPSDVDWRLLMIDDGSKDGTFAIIENLSRRDNRVTGIQFSRNFGKEAAIYAGLKASRGEYIGIIDADLQQPPVIALAMLQELIADDGVDCVAAYQENRREGPVTSAMKKSFYRVFAKASRTDVLPDASDFRVFKRCVAEAILELPEYYRFSKGLFSWVGFKVKGYPYTPEERMAGSSKWSLASLFQYAFEGLLSFTTRPLHAITVIGVVISLVAFVYAIVLILRTLIMGVDIPGYTSTLAFILLFGGGQFLAIGILGEYLARTYIQGKNRPVYIVRLTTNQRNSDTEDIK